MNILRPPRNERSSWNLHDDWRESLESWKTSSPPFPSSFNYNTIFINIKYVPQPNFLGQTIRQKSFKPPNLDKLRAPCVFFFGKEKTFLKYQGLWWLSNANPVHIQVQHVQLPQAPGCFRSKAERLKFPSLFRSNDPSFLPQQVVALIVDSKYMSCLGKI